MRPAPVRVSASTGPHIHVLDDFGGLCRDNERRLGGGRRPGQTSRCGDGVLPLRCPFGSEDPQRRSGDEAALKVEIVVNGACTLGKRWADPADVKRCILMGWRDQRPGTRARFAADPTLSAPAESPTMLPPNAQLLASRRAGARNTPARPRERAPGPTAGPRRRARGGVAGSGNARIRLLSA